MKLANWNLQRASTPARRAVLREQTDKVAADVWVFTETHAAFSPGTHYHSCHSAAGRDQTKIDKDSDYWVSLWSKFPLERLKSTDPTRTVAARVCPEGAAPFLIYGTVLPWIGSKWRTQPWAGGAVFREALREQIADWKKLREENAGAELFVLGDFNQDLAIYHYYGKRENHRELAAALKDCGLVALTAGDDDPIRRDSPPWACIDHICAQRESHWSSEPAVRWPATSNPDKCLSDHFGVAVNLTPRSGGA